MEKVTSASRQSIQSMTATTESVITSAHGER